jgi:hypothetical protein
MALVINPPVPVDPERVDGLPPGPFRDLLYTEGQRVRYARAIDCPCKTADERARERIDCPVCAGERFIYPDALQVETIAVVQDVTRSKELLARHGMFEAGAVKISMRGEFAPCIRDRLTLLDAFITLNVLRERRAGAVDELRHPIVVPENLIVGPEETDLAESGVIYLQMMDPDTGTAGAVLEEGVHFEVTAAGHIDWALGDALGVAPLVGGLYSLCHFARPSYLVTTQPHVVRRMQDMFDREEPVWATMPVQVFGKLDNATARPV